MVARPWLYYPARVVVLPLELLAWVCGFMSAVFDFVPCGWLVALAFHLAETMLLIPSMYVEDRLGGEVNI